MSDTYREDTLKEENSAFQTASELCIFLRVRSPNKQDKEMAIICKIMERSRSYIPPPASATITTYTKVSDDRSEGCCKGIFSSRANGVENADSV